MAGPKKWLKGKYTPINPRKYIGDYQNITYRSSWERNLCVWFDNTPEILRWSSETTIVPYYDPVTRKDRKYFVDFRIITRSTDGKPIVTLIEVKPFKQTVKPRANKNKSEKTTFDEVTAYATNMAKWAAAREYCILRGWSFKIITEREIFGDIDKSSYKTTRRAGAGK